MQIDSAAVSTQFCIHTLYLVYVYSEEGTCIYTHTHDGEDLGLRAVILNYVHVHVHIHVHVNETCRRKEETSKQG